MHSETIYALGTQSSSLRIKGSWSEVGLLCTGNDLEALGDSDEVAPKVGDEEEGMRRVPTEQEQELLQQEVKL